MSTVVLGLDGASFELLEPWIADGTLPTFARVRSEGTATDMQSCLPPVTCPNWQCYATGTNPGKLGVFWWEHIDRETDTITSTSAADQFDGHYYWEYLDGPTAIINLPTTYPPPNEVDGVHIAGGPGAEQSGYTTPSTLETELVEQYDYAVHPAHIGDLSATDPQSTCIDEIYDLIDSRFEVLEDYVRSGEFELIHLTVFYINVLQHFYWDHEVVKEAWKRIDAHLATLLELDELDTLYVMSDHGSNQIETTFLVNVWLEQEGYLSTTHGVSDLLYSVGVTRERVRSVVTSLGIEWWLRNVVPRRLQTMVPDSSGNVTESGKEGLIDWENSRALASGQGPLYVLAEDSRERERIRDELVTKLDGLTHNGTEIIEAAVPTTELYEGPHVDSAPDILLRQAPGIHIDGAVGGERDPFERPTDWRGENKETGLFVAHGADIHSDATMPDMHILDIAPTVLHERGAAVPTNMDGTPRTELFESESEPGSREGRTQRPADSEQESTTVTESEVTDRLSDLGYLD